MFIRISNYFLNKRFYCKNIFNSLCGECFFFLWYTNGIIGTPFFQEQTWRDDCLNGWRTPQTPSSPQTPKIQTLGRGWTPPSMSTGNGTSVEREGASPLTPIISVDSVFYASEAVTDQDMDGNAWKDADYKTCRNLNTILTMRSPVAAASGVSGGKGEIPCKLSRSKSDNSSNGNSSKSNKELPESPLNNKSFTSLTCESPCDNENVSAAGAENSDCAEGGTNLEDQSPRKTAMKTGSTAIRRRPGRRMDKTKLKVFAQKFHCFISYPNVFICTLLY